MLYGEINSLSRQLTVQHQVRPLRFAYVVEKSEKVDAVFDAIFEDSYRRWGGRRTLIVPTEGGEIEDHFLNWLEWYDPDVLYSYAALSSRTIESLEKNILPAVFTYHHSHRDETDPNWSLPNHGIAAASSLTLLPSVGRTQQGELPCVADIYHFDQQDRFFTDNFGEISPSSPAGLFTTVTLKPNQAAAKKHFEGELVVQTCGEFLERVSSERNVIFLSQLSGLQTGILRTEYVPHYNSSLNLVVGDSFEDRLYFWNSRHFVDESNSLNVPALRIPTDKISDESFIKGLAEFLGSWNYMFPGSHGQKHITVRSYSLETGVLKNFLEQLKKVAGNLQIGIDENAPLPIPKQLEKLPYFFPGYQHKNRVNEVPCHIDPKEPAHFQYITPLHTSLKNGSYAVDIAIERYNNHSKFINKPHWWQLPKRPEVSRLFLTGRSRITRSGTLSIVYSAFEDRFLRQDYAQKNTIELSFPEDRAFFNYVLNGAQLFDELDPRRKETKPGYSETLTSSKGRGLQAIVHAFGALHPAFNFISNHFWREAIEEMMGFKKMASADGTTQTQVGERAKTKTYKDLKQLRYRSFHQFRAAEAAGSQFHEASAIQEVTASFEATLRQLVALNVFFQGYTWRCENCGNENWVTVQTFTLMAKCHVCEKERQVAVRSLDWEFKLNQRVGDALYRESVISELWTLGYLLDRAQESFYYVPQADLYRNHDDTRCEKEIDLLCVQDGNFMVGESKFSASGFNDQVIDKLLELADESKPDYVILSYLNRDTNIAGQAEKIRNAGFSVKTLSPDNTTFHEHSPWSYI